MRFKSQQHKSTFKKAFSDDYATETFYFPLSVQVEDEDSEDLYDVTRARICMTSPAARSDGSRMKSKKPSTIISPTSKWSDISATIMRKFSAS